MTELSFLNETVSRAKEISLALLSPEEVVLFLTIETDENLKNKLSEKNLNYILEKEGVTITNSKNALLKILAVKNKKDPSLGKKLSVKLNLNYLAVKYPSQIYFDSRTTQSISEIQNLQEIFPQKSEAIVIPNYKNENETSAPFEKYNYLLTSTSSLDSKELENFIKEKLAERLPVLKERILPDKTTVVEQIALPSSFQFEKTSIPNFEINYIFEPRLNFEFAYSKNSKFFASNSKSLLENYLKNQKKTRNIVKKLWESIFKSKQFKYLGIKYVDKL